MKIIVKSGFYLFLVLILIYLCSGKVGLSVGHSQIFKLILFIYPLVLLVLHACYTLSLKRGVVFLVLAGAVGWLMEVLGLSTGTIFGGHYVYNGQFIGLLNVPLSVIVYWAAFIYTGYSIVNFWVHSSQKRLPGSKNKNWRSLILLVVLDGCVVTAMDLFMDPIQVAKGMWTWLGGGPYFGVPIGNFIGWFLVTIIVTGMFRLFEYSAPGKKVDDQFILFMPVIMYFFLFITFMQASVQLGLLSLTPFGILFMSPVMIVSAFFWLRKKRTSSGSQFVMPQI